MQSPYPRDFRAFGAAVGVKADGVLDFGMLWSTRPSSGSAVFTRNNFPGNPVILGRERVLHRRLQAIMVNSGCSNVFTGEPGLEFAREWSARGAAELGMEAELVLPSSTGVIGRMPPTEKLLAACKLAATHKEATDFESFARAIMTTDTVPKLRTMELESGIRLCGVAKGAGMIQPDMATMLAFLCTDAGIAGEDLQRVLKFAVERTFNRVSIDSDTSTSDTAALLANGAAGVELSFPEASLAPAEEVPHARLAACLDSNLEPAAAEFAFALVSLCRELTRDIARDGEGATKLIELQVTEARDRTQALKIGRSVINSPLFKTAVKGADPNWGRIIMAIGKVYDEPVPRAGLKLYIGDRELNTTDQSPEALQVLSRELSQPEVQVRISLGTGQAQETLWGCDLTAEYVSINADYTT